MTFGDRLKQLRNDKKLTQRELASILKMGYSTLAMYETNKREPDFLTTGLIADFFNVSVDYLLGRVSYNEQPEINNQKISPEDLELLQKLKNLPPDKQKAIEILVSDDKQQSIAIDK